MALPPTRPSGPFRPTRLGQWEVIAKIAGGGMSAVYLGRRVGEDAPIDIPKVVALKIVRHDVRDDRLLKMFLEEGKLLARLVHPNIVRTLEVGGDAEQDFIAMELMSGKTLAAVHDTMASRDMRLNPELAAWAAARVADALHYAHELADEHGQPLQLVHRDVNPANVFATFNGEVKLFDFGLAKATAGEASGSHLLAGKLSYLSPEQIMQMPLDRRSDIFSLGTTLWELLTGKRLFRRESDIDTVRAVQLGPIPDPRQIVADIPEELARITKTALERNREHRYPTGAYLARELDAYVFMRTSPTDVAARLATLVDTLFPGEQKRQSGWLKPAVSGSISRASGPTSLKSGTSGPGASVPPPVSSTSGSKGKTASPKRSLSPPEVTAVMPGAPRKPAESDPLALTATSPGMQGGSATNIAAAPPTIEHEALDPLDALDQLELGSGPSTFGEPGPLTPREGVPASMPPSTARELDPAPFTPREGVPSVRPSVAPVTPIMGTPREGVPSVRPQSLSPSMPPPTGPSGGPASTRSGWPMSGSRLTPSVPPPPQRSRVSGPPSRGPSMPPGGNMSANESVPPPPLVIPTPSDAFSVQPRPQSIKPPPESSPKITTPAATAATTTAAKPNIALPSGGPLSVRGRLPRNPIPLPSSKKSVAPPAAGSSSASLGGSTTTTNPSAATAPAPAPAPALAPTTTTTTTTRRAITEPPDSDTQVDMPLPPNNKAKKR